MGEYATRKSDGQKVKIGTCEALYYLRWSQRKTVDYDFGNYCWFWRIPLPSEDDIKPGDFDYGRLLREGKYIPYALSLKPLSEEIIGELTEEKNTGLTQVVNDKLGMVINMPCYHGLKLPENVNGFKFFWNGKMEALHLCFLANHEKELTVGVKCNACGKMWSYSFKDIAPYIKSLWMKLRLLHQCAEYWGEHNDEPCPYSVIDKNGIGDPMEIYNLTGQPNDWCVGVNDQIVASGSWEKCRNTFIASLPDGVNWTQYDNDDWCHYKEIADMKDKYVKG